MRNYLIAGVFCLVIFAGFDRPFPASEKSRSCIQGDSLSCKTFKEKGGWGYDIYREGSLVIHQPNIPAIHKTHPFRSEADAKNTASLVIEKIRKGFWPPSVTIHELDSMKIVWKRR